MTLRCSRARCFVEVDEGSAGLDIALRSLDIARGCLSPLTVRRGSKLCACLRTNVGQRFKLCRLTCRSQGRTSEMPCSQVAFDSGLFSSCWRSFANPARLSIGVVVASADWGLGSCVSDCDDGCARESGALSSIILGGVNPTRSPEKKALGLRRIKIRSTTIPRVSSSASNAARMSSRVLLLIRAA